MQPCATFLAVAAFLAPAATPGSDPAVILERGRAEMARKDYPAALRTFLTMHAAADTPLAQAARDGIVSAYAHFETPEHALLLFRRAAGDYAPAMLTRLAVRYEQLGWFSHSARVYRQLAALEEGSAEVCVWQANVVRNTLEGGTKPEPIAEIRRMVAVDREVAARFTFPAERKQECRRLLHDTMFELASVWGLEMTTGCTAFSWHHWPQLEALLRETLAAFPDDPRAPEVRGYLARLRDLQSR
jgi:hypothetical protein